MWSASKGALSILDRDLAVLDPDKDGTVDLAKANAAGSGALDRLEKDHDGTVDFNELHERPDRGEAGQGWHA